MNSKIVKMMMLTGAAALLAACKGPSGEQAQDGFRYTIDVSIQKRNAGCTSLLCFLFNIPAF